MVKQYKELKQLIDDAKHICFFTGAGIDTEIRAYRTFALKMAYIAKIKALWT